MAQRATAQREEITRRRLAQAHSQKRAQMAAKKVVRGKTAAAYGSAGESLLRPVVAG